MVRGEIPLDVKYAACCVFRSFALYEDFIVYVTDQILLSVLLMRNASAKFKVSNVFFMGIRVITYKMVVFILDKKLLLFAHCRTPILFL
jgi:hypothetical protein